MSTTQTSTPTPNSVSTDPKTAAAQLATRVKHAEQAKAEQHATNAASYEARVLWFDTVAANFQLLGATEVVAREMAADFIDAATDFVEARMDAMEVTRMSMPLVELPALTTPVALGGKLRGVGDLKVEQAHAAIIKPFL